MSEQLDIMREALVGRVVTHVHYVIPKHFSPEWHITTTPLPGEAGGRKVLVLVENSIQGGVDAKITKRKA